MLHYVRSNEMFSECPESPHFAYSSLGWEVEIIWYIFCVPYVTEIVLRRATILNKGKQSRQ